MVNDDEYTLDQLIAATGFTRRQIRFYITKKLIPGSGQSRGPYAVYSGEVLQRLRLIATLKDRRIEPTGRRMTLDEISLALDDQMAGCDRDIPTDSFAIQESATDYIAHVKDRFSTENRLSVEAIQPSHLDPLIISESECNREMFATDATPEADDHTANQDLGNLLRHLHSLFAELGSDTRFITAEGSEQWQRVTTPDVEFHVRQPDDHRARLRLAAMARALARLLEREDEA